jgi:hypothetical protein
MMKRWVLLLCLLAACAETDVPRAATESAVAPQCSSAQRVRALPPDLREASGVAVSRKHPGILWVHNDSGEPVLFALDTLGRLRARITVVARVASDWEDIAVGPCGDDSCVYIGAIGDNLQNRSDRVVLRLPEPDLSAQRVAVIDLFRYQLPRGAQDVEAFFVMPDERIYLISKGRSGPVTLFAFPENSSTREANLLTELQQLTPGLVQLPEMVTSAAATPDGQTIVVRSYSALQLYSFKNNQLVPQLAGGGFDLQPLREHQGEGVDITAAGTVFLVSEKGLDEADPPLSRVSCQLLTG